MKNLLKKKNNRASETKKEKKPEVIKNCLDILPIRSMDAHLEAFRLADGSYMDILQILSRDLHNMDDDSLQMEIFNLMKILKTVGCDLKFVSAKFPLNLTGQKNILQHHRENVQDEVRQLWLDRQIHELETVEENISTLHFYLFYFGATEDEFIRNRESILKYGGSGNGRLFEDVSFSQKVNIVQKLCNPNTLINLYGGDEPWT